MLATKGGPVTSLEGAFALLQGRMQRFAAQLSRGSPLTAQQTLALSYLKLNGPCSVRALQRALGIQQSTASELVERLYSAELVLREKNPLDGRTRKVSLTRKGEERLSQQRKATHSFYEEMFSRLEERDRRRLEEALSTLLSLLPEDSEHR